MSDYNGDLAASRKLSEEEASELRELLISQLSYSKDEQEDVNDLLDYTFAMTSNGKSLSYMVEELVSMEMSVCQEPQAHLIAKQIATFLEERVNQVQSEEPEEEEEQKQSHVVSLKSSGVGNALTMSGALGASRERGKKNDDTKKKQQDNRRDSKKTPQQQPRGGRALQGNDRRSSGGRGGGAGRGRLTQSEAFERLSGGRNNDRRPSGGGGRRGDDRRNDQGRPGRGEMWRGGGRGDMGRAGGRGSPGQRGGRGGRGSPNQRGGGRNAPMSGNRRSRDDMRGEEDFIPAGRGGRGDGRFQGRSGARGGRRDAGNRGGGRIRSDYEEVNKRQRTDEYGWEEQGGGYSEWSGGYDEGYNDYNWRGSGGFRGGGRSLRGRAGRGRSARGGGRGFAPEGGEQQAGMEANGEGGTEASVEAAVGHPSPLVAASFGGRVYRGRGRGRGRGGRGGYRAQVAGMIASKTWVRPKKEGEGGDTGGDSKQSGDSATGAGEG